MVSEPTTARFAAPEAARQLRSSWRIPIAFLLGLSIGALVLVAASTVLVISLWSGVQSTVHLLQQQAVISVDTVQERLEDHLAPAQEQLYFINDLIVSGRLDPRDDRRMEDVLTGALAATPQVDGIVFIDLSLHMRGVMRSGGGAYWVDEDQSLNPDFQLMTDPQTVRESKGWGELAWSTGLDVPVQILRQPVVVGGELVGMLGAGASVLDLSRFVRSVETEFGSHVFIMRGRGQVLAHASFADGIDGLSADKPVPLIGEVGDPVLAQIWSTDAVPVEGLEGDGLFARELSFNGEIWYFVYRKLDTYGPEPWYVGSYFRGSDLEEEFDRLEDAAIAGVIVVVLAIVAAFLIGRRIAGPVHRLAISAQHIGELEFDQVETLAPSRMRELDEAAGAFNLMLGGLKWFENYVPRKLVRRLMHETNSTLLSEEREVTLMFTDIVGFTTLAEHLPAGETAAFLNHHFATITACVEAEGGTVDKYIGDAVMAFWGAPEYQADHAARACRAAQTIASAISADNDARRRGGEQAVRVRIGLHTGLAVVGNIGAPDRVNYTVVGDTVNTCQRIEALGKMVQTDDDVVILMSGATRSVLDGAVASESVGRHALKGRSGEIEVFRLTS